MPATNSWLDYGSLYLQPKLTNFSLITTFIGSLSLRGQLWWGGLWDSIIGTTKRCLRKVLGRFQFSGEGLNTTLVAIEADIYSRPIVQAEESDALTTAHLLFGERLTTIPSGPEAETNGSLTKEFKIRQKFADDFWRRWQREYLTAFRSFHEVRQQQASTNFRRGDVALLQEDVRPRHMWKRALIEQLREGRDRMIRTVVHRPQKDIKSRVRFSWSCHWRLTRVGRMWRNIFLLNTM